jgi:4-amino-4-deoxy-L-arabinose transferase-like glycosyltransferase
VLLAAGLAALSYAWALGADPLEPYYAAAVRSMSLSWHNFIFGAFDPAGTVTLDKLPGAFWMQALAVRAFGYHPWVIVAPQAIEGALTVLVLYRAVRRLAGVPAGLVAAFVVVVSPAAVALNRGNISDSLMILLLVLAADAVSGAVVSGRLRGLVLAGVWVGLAFQAKMIEAWLVLPALGLAYLVSAPGTVLRRVRHLLLAGAVTGVVSLAWLTAVSLAPASGRPYIDGSGSNSAYEQVFVYNGFGRFGDQTPLQQLAGQGIGLGAVTGPGPAGPGRLFGGDLGRDAGWLLPGALVIAGWGLLSRRRGPRTDPLLACFLLWGGWLVVLGVTFSLATTINSYYVAALVPAVAAIVGAGVARAWAADRSRLGWQAGLAAVIAGTAGYAAWLVAGAGTDAPGWLLPAVIVVGAVTALMAAAGLLAPGLAGRLVGGAGGADGPGVVGGAGNAGGSGAGRSGAVGDRAGGSRASEGARRPVAVALAAGLVAAGLVPAVASAKLVLGHEGAFDTPFEPVAKKTGIDALFVQVPAQVAQTIPALEAGRRGAHYLLATESAAVASVFVEASGQEALPIGGFTGTAPSPTLAQLKADIRASQFHLVLAGPSADPRLRWIAAHCQKLPFSAGALDNYFCTPQDAG